MGKRKSLNKYRPKRRKFSRNQFTVLEDQELECTTAIATDTPRPSSSSADKATSSADTESEISCSSAKKLRLSIENSKGERDNYYIIMSFQILKAVIGKLKCEWCRENLELVDNEPLRAGLSHKLSLQCKICGILEIFHSSSATDNANPDSVARRSMFDINLRSVVAFREIGKGHKAMSTFAGFMNLSKPISKTQYDKANEKLLRAYQDACFQSCKEAAFETTAKLGGGSDSVTDCQVSVDGTWQKRGHSSLNGVVTIISKESGKCLDHIVLSKTCKGCQIWSNKTNHPGYNGWVANHDCSINHKGSSGSMESKGAIELFNSSVQKYNLCYKWYIGDGDSSSFSEVVNARPYGNTVTIEKRECIGHVQKRIGTRCRNLRNSLKGTILSDGKRISGKGRLTDKAINTIQNHYGMAIRQNTDSIDNMKRSIIAVLYHNSDIGNEDERHKYCPRAQNSWCKWWLDILNGTRKYKKNVNLPLAIKRELEPIFQDLCKDDLLKKCLHGQTQNENESLNSIIWKKSPKTVFVSRKVLEVAVCSAIIEFNNGCCGIIKVMDGLGLSNGYYTNTFVLDADRQRVQAMRCKSSEKAKIRRKKLRSIRKGFLDKEKEHEKSESYLSGAF